MPESALESLDTNYWLQKFLSLCAAKPGSIPYSTCVGNPRASVHFVVAAAIHGDEVGAIPAFVGLLESGVCDGLSVSLTLFIGNYEAILANRRFIEHDLNRIILPSQLSTKEHLRAQEILQLLNTADYFLDFHQTIQPTRKPFYIFIEDEATMNFARYLQGSDTCVIGHALPAGQMSTEQYMQSRKRPGATLEIGPKGINPESFTVADKTLRRLIEFAKDSRSSSVKNLAALASAQPQLAKVKIVHQEKFMSTRDALSLGWKNFDPVQVGSELGRRASGEKFLSPVGGYMLFPKYPNRDENGAAVGTLPNHIFEIAMSL